MRGCVTGGSTSNMYGMVLARYKTAPETKTKGSSCVPPLVCFASEDVSQGFVLGLIFIDVIKAMF